MMGELRGGEQSAHNDEVELQELDNAIERWLQKYNLNRRMASGTETFHKMKYKKQL